MVDKLETTPPRVVVSYAYLVFSQPPNVYIRLCKHGNHFTFFQSKTRSHPTVTFLYKNILERSISYVITQI